MYNPRAVLRFFMETIITIVGIGILIGIAYLIYRLRDFQAPRQDDKAFFEHMESLRKELRDSTTRLDDRLSKGLQYSTDSLQKQFSQTSKIVEDVTKKLTQLDETNKQVKDFAGQMQSLENILKNPKHRAVLSEYWLESLLGHVLSPNQYKMQYAMGDGLIVDAAIFFKNQIIPVDAKFSLEKYNKMMEEQDADKRARLEKEFKADLKDRIDETAKYINPEKGTTEFAFMFLPAEGIYYNLMIYNVGGASVNTTDLHEYAFKKHVIIVSPSSFFAYLQTVIQGLKALKMEESVQEIRTNVEKLSRHLNAYQDHMIKLGNHLGTTVGAYNNASREYGKIDKDIYKITAGAEGGKAELNLIDKPAHHE